MTQPDCFYFTTAMKLYGLSKNQLDQAIITGLISVKREVNPHYKNAAPARILRRSEIEANLEKIKLFQKNSKNEKTYIKLDEELDK